jgi:amino acid adenylation domain-containing protein
MLEHSLERRNNTELKDIYPLTPFQEGMLFHHQYEQNSSRYVGQLTIDIQGDIDLSLFFRAIQQVVNRHSILKAGFQWEKLKKPMHVELESVVVPAVIVDMGSEKSNRNRIVLDYALHDRQKGFDLSKAPLIRIHALDFGDNDFHFIWTFHRIILDDQSLGVALHEIFITYDQLRSGHEGILPPAISFKNHLLWIKKQKEEKAKEFWKEYLNDLVRPTLLFKSQPSPKIDEDSLQTKMLKFSLKETEAFQAFANAGKITINTLLHCIFGVMVSKLTRQKDVVFGSTVNGRPMEQKGIESILGMFANTIPCRIRLNPQENIVSLAQTVQENQSKRMPYEYYSLAEIQKLTALPFTATFFDAVLVFENNPLDDSSLNSLYFKMTNLAISERTSYPLTIVAFKSDVLVLTFIWDRRYVPGEIMDFIEKGFRDGVVWMKDPGIPVRDIIPDHIGFRAEPIADAMKRLPDVQDAAVALNETSIYAYYVSEKLILPALWRASLLPHLPDSMIPDYFICLPVITGLSTIQEHLNSLKPEKMAADLKYWTEELGGELPILNIRGSHPRPAVQNYKGRRLPVALDVTLTEKLDDHAKRNDATIFITLLSAYSLLLAIYGNQQEVIVGASWNTVESTEQEAPGAGFVNNLPIRVDLSGNPAFTQLLDRLQKKTIAAAAHPLLAFGHLVEELQIPLDTSRSPIFQYRLVYGTDFGEINHELASECVNAGYDLTLTLKETNSSIRGYIEYPEALYDERFVEDFFSHFILLLNNLASEPEKPVFSQETVLPMEKNLILDEWSSHPADYPLDATINSLFEEQVRKHPDRIAVSFGDKFITYVELDGKAKQIANALRNRGVKAECVVGLYFERSVEMLVAILGVVKSGGAYLPLDVDLPEERLHFMLKDSAAVIILCSKERMICGVEKPLLTLEEIDGSTFGEGGNPGAGDFSQNTDLLYVIYTSGTTGDPKGVMITHKNVVRLLVNDRLQFDFSEKDVWTMYHSYNFDFSVWEMYGALLYGGRLVVVPKMTARDPKKFRNLLSREKVTILNQTPQAFYQLVEVEQKKTVHDLDVRLVIFGGEALSPIKLKFWKESFPRTKLINMYGITETTVHVTYKEIGDEEIRTNVSNIGKVIPTLSSYVLNRNGQLLPVSAPGELYVGGAGVARGYLNRPELTTERFVANPHKPGERLYRSGDLVRLLPSGEMEYLGRIDHQVKIRGFRIELDEIQNRIIAFDGVKDALVLDRPGPWGEKVLCVYFTTGKEISVSTLRDDLSRWLPDYMVPSFFFPLEKLPLTANGKVDRRKLPDISEARRL